MADGVVSDMGRDYLARHRTMLAVRWDLFCHVIDNFGDIGVCWRLACDLATRGHVVRLFADDGRALSWMAGVGTGVTVADWPRDAPTEPLPDVVIEAFGCTLPDPYLQAMAGALRPPCWIDLEYLSAEAYVERSHGLPSPRPHGPARGLVTHFFYPGFTPATGGLLREPGLLAARAAFDRDPWLAARGAPRQPQEQVVVLFGYDNPALPQLLDHLAGRPTLLLLPPGALQDHALEQLGSARRRGELRAVALPYLAQREFDRLLWSADLNFVRGEDSLVRAIWAGAPFVWQIYAQHDGVHAHKLHAFVERMLAGASPAVGGPVRAVFDWWNGIGQPPATGLTWPDATAWQRVVAGWRDHLARQDDLTTQLLRFAARTR